MTETTNETINGKWTDAASIDDVFEDNVVAIVVAGKEIALYGVAGEVYATDNLCTHGAARLSDGFLEGHEIECPMHQGKFDVCTGQALCAPLTQNIRIYPTRVENNRVYLNLLEGNS
jgi:naphthalene 1,2-dioxygenase ferredoxin component